MISQANKLRRSVHYWIYFTSLCLIVISLPASRYTLGISFIILAANWLTEPDLLGKLRNFASNKAAVAFTLIYVLSILGLIWSVDLKYALNNDLRLKLPTLFMPLIIVTSPVLDNKKIRLLLILFISSVLVVSLIGLCIRVFQAGSSYRDASPFMPGLYFGMMLIISAFQLPILIKQITKNRAMFLAGLALSAWMILFVFYLRTLSGIVSFVGVSFYLAALLVRSFKSTLLRLTLAVSFLLLIAVGIWPMISIYKQTHSEVETDFRTLGEFTEYGNRYRHDTLEILRENGNLVYTYIADSELSDAWNKRSELDYYGNDLTGQEVRYTLYRYMASKGLRKDRNGFKLLTDDEISAVEKGITNYLNIKRPGFYARVYEEMMGLYIYRKTGYKEASWSSLSQRLDMWRASIQAFKKHPLLGWGTGSILHAVDYGFETNGSSLAGNNTKPHSQYLYILLTLGILGLLAFISLYSYAVFKTGVYKILMFKIFLIVYAINFLANNSMESHIGQSLFVFFSLFYFFIYPRLNTTQPEI